MWALMANPRRSGGNCSASRPLPTGCCGETPIRATMLASRTSRSWRPAPWRRTLPRTAARRTQEPPARHAPCQLGIAELDEPGREGAHCGQERDRLHRDPELIDDREEDQRQQDGECVVDGVGDRQQAERATRPDVHHATHLAGIAGASRPFPYSACVRSSQCLRGFASGARVLAILAVPGPRRTLRQQVESEQRQRPEDDRRDPPRPRAAPEPRGSAVRVSRRRSRPPRPG